MGEFFTTFIRRCNGVLAPEVPEAPGNRRVQVHPTQFLDKGLVDFFGMKNKAII